MVSTELDNYALRNKMVSRTGGNCFSPLFSWRRVQECTFLWENRRGNEGRESRNRTCLGTLGEAKQMGGDGLVMKLLTRACLSEYLVRTLKGLIVV